MQLLLAPIVCNNAEASEPADPIDIYRLRAINISAPGTLSAWNSHRTSGQRGGGGGVEQHRAARSGGGGGAATGRRPGIISVEIRLFLNRQLFPAHVLLLLVWVSFIQCVLNIV